jgi:hypothetical protein
MLEEFISNPCENSLTASVFSHLLHLPVEIFWQILRNACYSHDLPDNPGEPQIIPWPMWDGTNTRNSQWVIPDFFMRCADFDLIIEAKRWDHVSMQNQDQWMDQLIAWHNKYKGEKRKVILLALGGIHLEKDEKLTHGSFVCTVHMCRWSTLLLECQRKKRKLEEENKINPCSQTVANVRILNDLIALFALHGYPALQWFDDFDFKSNLLELGRVGDIQQYLQKIRQQFQSHYEFNR